MSFSQAYGRTDDLRWLPLRAGATGGFSIVSEEEASSSGVAPWSYASPSGGITNTSDVTMWTSSGVGKRNYITSLQAQNVSATATEVVVKSGSTVLWRANLQASMTAPKSYRFQRPLRGGTDEALTVACLTSGTQTYVNAQGYQDQASAPPAAAATLAELLLGSETDGIAIDFTDMSIVVRDTVTPANNFSGDPNSWLTYSSPSTKWVLGSDGLLSSASTIRREYSGATALGARMEEARTSLALHSCDLTNAAWVASSMTTAKTATGPDGVANSATTITATAGNATVLQSIVSASAARFTSCYIKRRTGSGTVEMTQDGGALWTAVTVTSDWTRVNIASATVTNPSVGLRVVTSGDAVDVGFFNITTGAFNTSPIRTTTASVTRAYDNVFRLLSGMNYNAAAGTLYAKFRPLPGTTGTNRYVSIVDGTSANHMSLVASSGNLGTLTVTATTAQASIIGAAWTAGDVHKIALSAQLNEFKMSMDGVAGTDDTSGIMPVSPTHLRVSGLLASFGSANSHIEQVMYLPRVSTTPQLNTVTT